MVRSWPVTKGREWHSALVVARRMWVYLREVFFMMCKGKRKLVLGAHLLIKHCNKAVSCSVANLFSHHHGHHGGRALRRCEYEFSCSGSPDQGSFSIRRLTFPCLSAADEVDEPSASTPTPPRHMIEYYANAAAASPTPSSPGC